MTWQSTVAALGDNETLGTTGAWGNCVEMTEGTDGYRYVSSNSVPNHYMNPYCPLGIGLGYCIGDEVRRAGQPDRPPPTASHLTSRPVDPLSRLASGLRV